MFSLYFTFMQYCIPLMSVIAYHQGSPAKPYFQSFGWDDVTSAADFYKKLRNYRDEAKRKVNDLLRVEGSRKTGVGYTVEEVEDDDEKPLLGFIDRKRVRFSLSLLFSLHIT